MNYNISSTEFALPHLKDLLRELSDYFSTKGVRFYIIGATARDIVMRQLLGCLSDRRTLDLDIAIAIDNWALYSEISQELVALDNFSPASIHSKHKFKYKGIYELDILPFGGVEHKDGNIYWPPENDIAISVKGYNEAMKGFLTVTIDGEFEVRVVSLSGLVLLKLNAWLDRHLTTRKDAEDIYYIIKNYYDAFEEQYNKAEYHQEVYDDDNFDIVVAGATWLGYDISTLLLDKHQEFYIKTIDNELKQEERSQLIGQIVTSDNSAKYEIVYRALSALSNSLKDR